MKRHIPTFDEFVSEQVNPNFDPATASQEDIEVSVVKSLEELEPGQEYNLTIDGTKHEGFLYKGVTNGYYIFNQEDHKEEPLTFDDAKLKAVIDANGVSKVSM